MNRRGIGFPTEDSDHVGAAMHVIAEVMVANWL